jgi:hypothetical protein
MNDRQRTYVLVAGHCILEARRALGVQRTKWYAFNNAGTRIELGESSEVLYDATVDAGAIAVGPNWITASNPPVYAVTAEWEKKSEKSYPVKGQLSTPEVGALNCVEANIGGAVCGTIRTINPPAPRGVTGLVETQPNPNRRTWAGDSGAPVIKESEGGYVVEGVYKGRLNERPVYYPIDTVLTALNRLGLELLNTANELRPTESEAEKEANAKYEKEEKEEEEGAFKETKGEEELVTGEEKEDNEEEEAELAFKSPALKVCKKVPLDYVGLYTESHCATNSTSGTWAWSTPGVYGAVTWFCLLATSASHLYTEGLCQTQSGSAAGRFLEKGIVEAFPKLLATLKSSTLLGTVAGVTAEVECTGGLSEGTPETGQLIGQGDFDYTGCTVAKPAKCEVASAGGTAGTIATGALMGTLTSAKLITFAPESGTTWLELEFKNKSSETCGIAAGTKAALTGKQMCAFATGIETPATEHEFTCSENEGELELGAKSAKYQGLALLRVEGAPLWKIK